MNPSAVGFAIVGTGSIAAVHARAVRAVPGAELRAVHNRSPEKARAFAAEHGGEAVEDLGALLARRDVEAVCIATPSGAHGEIALAALAAGKHVLCEKPLEISTARIDAMIAAAERHGRILAAVFQFRFGRGPALLRRAVEEGRFGRIALCSASVKWWRDPAYYSGSAWKGTGALDGGGALMNQAIHAVDLLQWLAGMPARAGGRTATLAHRIEMEDTASAWLEFPGGALGAIEAATSCRPGSPLRLEICGHRGSAALEEDRVVRWEFADPRPEDAEIRRPRPTVIGGGASDPRAIGGEGHRLLVEDLVRAIRTGSAPLIPAKEARNAVAIIEAIYRSSRAGGAPVEV